ncbi:MAG: MBG domain-containing protein [Nibricoccus sp.]
MIPMHRILLRACAIIGVSCALVPAVLAGELKVDINNVSRNQVGQTEPGYTMWSSIIPSGNPGTTTTGTAAATQTFTTSTGEVVTISFAQTALSASRGGTGIIANWFQVGAQGTAKLVSDGIGAGPVATVAGGEIQMTITGLSPGDHTLLTYHNAVDNPATNFFGPIDIFVNGTQVVDNLQQTIRAASTLAAATAYLEFSVSGPGDVVTILFSADPAPSVTLPPGVNLRRTPFINGFEIDTPNTSRIANTPYPVDFDEHANADEGGLTLGWLPALSGNVVSHDVYFGTDLQAVKTATRGSPEYKGNQVSTTFPVSGLSNHLKYYWRIDEINTLGNVTKGTTWYFKPRQLAFPGAEGYGRFAIGGRGGRVVKVTSLADYGSSQTPIPGTLRYAIEQETGPRTIVFDVSGLITLQSRLTLSQPYVTIAGQTAPGKGITTRGWPLGFSGARNSVIRYFRNRPGNIAGVTLDGGGLAGCDFSIMDHCSISWAIDEEFSSRTAKNITLQRTLISEALNIAGHQNYPPGTAHGYAATIGGDIGSFHHNLLAHNEGRNWSLGGGLDGSGNFAGRLDITNNVVYNWRGRTTDGGAMEVNFVNNYYKPGAASRHFYALTMNHENNAGGSQRAYFAGNVMPGRFDETNQEAGRRSVVESDVIPPTYETFVNAPFFPSYVETQSARDAYKRVLSDVGANAPIDDHDVRVIGETLTGTYTYTGTGPFGGYPGLPNSQDDVGGWEDYPEFHRSSDFDSDNDGLPDWWEKIKGLNPNSAPGDFSDANADADNNGYTNLEEYLNWLALPHADVEHDSSIEIDLSSLTRGYTNGPVHAVFDAQNGQVILAADGKTAIFVPTRNIIGLGSFRYTVTDAEGSSMTGLVNLHIFARPPVIATMDLSGVYGSGLNIGIQATHLPTSYSATGLPPGLELDAATGVISGAPTGAGTYTVVISATNVAGTTSVTLTFSIEKALATLTLVDQLRSYTGSPVNASATTSPVGLNIVYTYDGVAHAPTYPGAYDVVATIDEPNYIGTATAELSIAATAAVRRAPKLFGEVDGSVQLLTGEHVLLTGWSMISLDLLVPGLPSVRTFGTPTYGGTIDAEGATTPGNYTITLFGRPVLRHTVRRIDPIALPTVDVPPAPDGYHSHHSKKNGWLKPFLRCPPKPAGNRQVFLNRETDSIGDFTTLCHLTHNHHGPVVVPPGTYGDFSAHGRGSFILGVAGSTEPSVYNLQKLTLSGQASIQIVGPVLLRVAGDVRFDGTGVSGSPDQSFTIEIARGDLSLDGRVILNASVVAPNGRVTIGGRSILNGRTQSDDLLLQGDGLLKDPEL